MSFIRKTLLLRQTGTAPNRSVLKPGSEGQSSNRGHLYLIGGAEDKRSGTGVLQDMLKQFKPASIILIPTASQYPRDVADGYLSAFRDLDFRNLEILDIRYPEDADRPSCLEKLNQASLVFFSGGDQVKLVTTLEGSLFMDLLRNRFGTGQLHLAGSSAGTAAMSDLMLFDGDERGYLKGSVKAARGFGFLKGITLDTHFGQRDRYQRLAQFFAAGHSDFGIGVDEDTAFHLMPGGAFRVTGSNKLSLLSKGPAFSSNFAGVNEGQSFFVSGMEMAQFCAGEDYHLPDSWPSSQIKKPRRSEAF